MGVSRHRSGPKEDAIAGFDKELAQVARESLTLLLVEDEPISRELALLRLQGRFKRLLVAADGSEGLRLFREQAPDLVLSDHVMPGLSGSEMAGEIRLTDRDVPIILMTSTLDNGTLLEAINLGVNRFVPKPLDFDLLDRILNVLVRELLDRREFAQCRLQELELLRDRDSYNCIQQETARRKERHVVRHDLRDQVVAGGDGVRWGLTVTHSPRDIMCGDGYTVRRLFDGRLMVFVVDAMGSGLSASLSALLATSFCNYQVDHLHQWQNFNLLLFLTRFQEYLGGILLEEEAISCGFLLVDLAAGELEMAMFGLPPMLVRGLDGEVLRIVGANPPLCIYSDDVVFTTLPLAGVADLMVMTDGFTDAALHAGGSYRERLEEDFRFAPTLAALQRLFGLHTDSEDRDDLTLLHLQRLDLPAPWRWRGEPLSGPDGVPGAIDGLLRALQAEVALDEREEGDLVALLALTLGGALEHLDPDGAGATCGSGEKACSPPKERFLDWSASLWRQAQKPLLVVEVSGGGSGFYAGLLRAPRTGSILSRIDELCDGAFVEEAGCRLLLLKTMEGGAVCGY